MQAKGRQAMQDDTQLLNEWLQRGRTIERLQKKISDQRKQIETLTVLLHEYQIAVARLVNRDA
jgi:hypothetical protein